MPRVIADTEDIAALCRLEDIADKIPTCPQCFDKARLVTGKTIYPHRTDLHEKYFWLCENDDAFVGCHPGTTKTLGTLANAVLRRARSEVHRVLDPLWGSNTNWTKARNDVYAWLAQRMELTEATCHVGMFDLSQCSIAYELLTENDVKKLINL